MNQVRKLSKLELAQLDRGRNEPEIAQSFNAVGKTAKQLSNAGTLKAVGEPHKDADGRFTKQFTWDQFPMASITVKIKGYGIGPTIDTRTGTRTKIYTKGREIDKVALSFEIDPGENVNLYVVRNYQLLGKFAGDNVPPLDVKIAWRDKDGKGDFVPDIRYTDDNDMIFVFVDGTGATMMFEVSVIWRGHIPYVSLQELSGSQLALGHQFEAEPWKINTFHAVKTDLVEGGECFAWLTPETPENAYPSADSLSTYRWMPELIDMAISEGRFLLAQDCNEPIAWEPPVFNPAKLPVWVKKNQWEPMAVGFYNESGGIGRCFRPLYDQDGNLALDENGRVQFDEKQIGIHFGQLLGEKTVVVKGKDTVQLVPVVSFAYPSFTPMTWVVAKVFEKNGQLRTSSIRSMPAEAFNVDESAPSAA